MVLVLLKALESQVRTSSINQPQKMCGFHFTRTSSHNTAKLFTKKNTNRRVMVAAKPPKSWTLCSFRRKQVFGLVRRISSVTLIPISIIFGRRMISWSSTAWKRSWARRPTRCAYSLFSFFLVPSHHCMESTFTKGALILAYEFLWLHRHEWTNSWKNSSNCRHCALGSERLKKSPEVTDIQLQIEDEMDPDCIRERMKVCQKLCRDVSIGLCIPWTSF